MRTLFIIVLAAFILSIMLSAGFSQSKGGQWQFENNGFDTADWDTNDDSGTKQDSAVFSSEPPLQEGLAYLFLDTAYTYDCFRIPDNNDLDFDDENIGISAWIYPLELKNDVYFLVNKGRQDSTPKTTNYAIRISNSQHLEFLIRDANNQAKTVPSSFIIPANQWTFVAIYFDFAAHTVYMWNDPTGSPVDTLTFTENFFSNNDPLTIGAWYNAIPTTPAIKPFKGRMDDVRISGRVDDIIPIATSITNRTKPAFNIGLSGIEVFPNPIQSSQAKVNFRIRMPERNSQDVTLKVYNILGQLIFATNLKAAENPATISWNLQNDYGHKVNSGIYFIQIKGESYQIIKRLLILK